MLKWAVNNPNRPSLVDSNHKSQGDQLGANFILHKRNDLNLREQRRLRRKSTGNEKTNIRRKILYRDKENNLTSTPLPLHRQSLSPLRKYDSLRDLSNIPATPDFLSTPLQAAKHPKVNISNGKSNLLQYAPTLPTFDAEYSPCSLVPGPLLALRGIGIADSYFEKPRYLSNDAVAIHQKRLKLATATPIPNQLDQAKFHTNRDTKTISKPLVSLQQTNNDESLSSSRMDDTTLDRMIDAILESARKERRLPKLKQQTHVVMSPTYTAAEDPASDLNELWHHFDEKDRFNEREVRTPDSLEHTLRNSADPVPKQPFASCCHLRRQRAVRRKRKHGLTNQDTVNKPIMARTANESFFANNSLLRKSFDELVEMDTPKGYSNLSPDSGRNSGSDLDESRDDNNSSMCKRLSFTPSLLASKRQSKAASGEVNI